MDYSNYLIPQVGTWVTTPNINEPGVVTNLIHDGYEVRLGIQWLRSKKQGTLLPAEVECGFPLGIEVQDVPLSHTRPSLGEGLVREKRKIGGRDQVLVEFPEEGRLHWIPFQNLKHIKGIQQRFELGQTGATGNAERFRLRSLAYAIQMWHENTGSLSRLDIDPLPHQIHLVHHILASGNLNWLIADDVGLGKTIEIGMLLSALLRRGTFRRILLVTPAGLVNQWKEELHHKFNLSDFQIYGDDFQVHDPRHWKLYDFVIGSMDRFKSDSHLINLMQAGTWDLVVFDEAHRLSRAQVGMKYSSSDRYRLAATLRKKTDSLLLLSATPHQGKQDKFQALLELLRPEFRKQIQTLALNPEVLGRMVIRNDKKNVTDAEGNFIFCGKTTLATQVTLGPEEVKFDQKLQEYIRMGYAAGGRKGGHTGRAIGFVMSIYRKLAASSIAAIEHALTRRLHKLRREHQNNRMLMPVVPKEADERYVGEWEELVETESAPFFEGEISLLEELIGSASRLVAVDGKIGCFMRDLLPTVLKNNSQEKILIFTEYRATQEHLAEVLRQSFGDSVVALLHGGLKHQEREDAIAKFEEEGQFLISTEAGGEGINLHHACNIMVNYDLPWNPMRLVQRVGRLYRYGQKKKVVVINLNVPNSIDNDILTILYQRLYQVVHDMASLSEEFRPGIEDEILGQMAEVLDLEDILHRAGQETVQRSQENIDLALERAREAVEKQRELLAYAAGYDPDEIKGELKITLDHVGAFVGGMMKHLGVEVVETTHKDGVMRIKLPEPLIEDLGMRGQYMRITLDRTIAARRKDIHMMDLESPLLQYMMAAAKDYQFDGRVAKIQGLDGEAVVASMLRWQNDQGSRMRQEFAIQLINKSGLSLRNPESFLMWLLRPAQDGGNAIPLEKGRELFASAMQALDGRLKEISNTDLHPENLQPVSAAWCNTGSLILREKRDQALKSQR